MGLTKAPRIVSKIRVLGAFLALEVNGKQFSNMSDETLCELR
jgi:hypothetical protein